MMTYGIKKAPVRWKIEFTTWMGNKTNLLLEIVTYVKEMDKKLWITESVRSKYKRLAIHSSPDSGQTDRVSSILGCCLT